VPHINITHLLCMALYMYKLYLHITIIFDEKEIWAYLLLTLCRVPDILAPF
jgi:hypothetical protein